MRAKPDEGIIGAFGAKRPGAEMTTGAATGAALCAVVELDVRSKKE